MPSPVIVVPSVVTILSSKSGVQLVPSNLRTSPPVAPVALIEVVGIEPTDSGLPFPSPVIVVPSTVTLLNSGDPLHEVPSNFKISPVEAAIPILDEVTAPSSSLSVLIPASFTSI